MIKIKVEQAIKMEKFATVDEAVRAQMKEEIGDDILTLTEKQAVQQKYGLADPTLTLEELQVIAEEDAGY